MKYFLPLLKIVSKIFDRESYAAKAFYHKIFFSNEFNESIDKAHELMAQVIPFIF